MVAEPKVKGGERPYPGEKVAAHPIHLAVALPPSGLLDVNRRALERSTQVGNVTVVRLRIHVTAQKPWVRPLYAA